MVVVCTHPGDRGLSWDLVLLWIPWDGVLPMLAWDDVFCGLSDS